MSWVLFKNATKPSVTQFTRAYAIRHKKKFRKPKKCEPERPKCDPRPEPPEPPKFNLEKSLGKWIRKYITGAPEPKKRPPHDPRPVCSPCLKLAPVPLPPFPKLHCVYEGVMENTGNMPPLDDENVFLLKQSITVWAEPEDREIAMLNYIETEEHIRDFHDPVSKFSSVGLRMVELADNKLHPFYNKFRRLTPLKCHIFDKHYVRRETKPPVRIRYNVAQLEKKCFFVDMKRFDRPSDAYCTKALGLKVNEKAMLDIKKKAKVKEMLQRARDVVDEDEANQPIFKKIDDSYMSQKCCN